VNDRERAFFLYGIGVGMKLPSRTDRAFEIICSWFLTEATFLPLMEQAKCEVDPVLRQNGALLISGLPFGDDWPQ